MSSSESKQSHTNVTYENVAFTSALYNSLAIVFLIICIGLSALLLIVLSNFVRPIMWAILTGAFLFTSKFYLTKITCESLKSIYANRTSLSIHLLILPFRLIDSISEFTWSFTNQNIRNIIILFISLLSTKFISLFYEILFSYTFIVCRMMFTLIELFTFYADKFSFILCTILAGYFIMLTFFWKDGYKSFLRFLSIPIWFNVFVLVSKILGSYRIYFIASFIMLTSLGIFSYIKEMVVEYKESIVGSSPPIAVSDSDPIEENQSSKRKNRLV
jgi:hypothetical protein